MATSKPNMFASYQLEETEIYSGMILTLNQKMVIQNRLSEAAERKVRLKYDSSEPLVFAQNEAHLSGQIEVLQELLADSDQAEETLRQQQSS